jgi:hypothetical protein
MVVRGLAQLLNSLGAGVYSESSIAGTTIFIARYPETPNSIIFLKEYGGLAPSGGLGYDTVAVQVIVRGEDENPIPVEAKAQQIYGFLHGRGNQALPDGTYLVGCFAQQPPHTLGCDSNNRHEYGINFYAEVRNQTAFRE